MLDEEGVEAKIEMQQKEGRRVKAEEGESQRQAMKKNLEINNHMRYDE